MRQVLAVLIVLLLAGCASVEVRALKPEARKPLGQALDPLLRAAYGAELAKCKVRVAMLDEDYFDVVMQRAEEGPTRPPRGC